MAYPPGCRVLHLATPAMQGDDVKFAQRYIGPTKCGSVDGIFGPKTVAGVKWYQQMRGLLVNGTVDAATWLSMGIHMQVVMPPAPPPPPVATGKPDATNTGVRAGVTLTVVASDTTYSGGGGVVSGKDFRGTVKVTGSGYTFRDCKFRGNGYVLLDVGDATGSLVEYCEFVPLNADCQADGIWAKNATFRRIHVHGTNDGMKAASGTVVEDSYIHGMVYRENSGGTTSTHNDGIQIWAGSSGITLRRSVVDLSGIPKVNACIMAAANNVTLDGNWFDGGGFSLNFDDQGKVYTGLVITNNRFGRHTSYGPAGIDPGYTPHVFQNNVWDDTGAPVGSLPNTGTAPTPPPVQPPPPPPVTPPPPPASTGKPDATNTGPRVPLTRVDGNQTFSVSQVVSGKDFHGYVRVTAANVNFVDCKFNGGTPHAGFGSFNTPLLSVESGGAVVEYCEFVAEHPDPSSDGIWAKNAHIRRCHIHGGVDGMKTFGNVTVEDSYIHGLNKFASDPNQGGGSTHNDGIQAWGSGATPDLTLKGNVIALTSTDNACLQTSVSTALIDRNWFDGGGCMLNFAGQGTAVQNIVVTNNRFGRHSQYQCPILLSTKVHLAVNSGNVWDDTGAAIPSVQQHD